MWSTFWAGVLIGFAIILVPVVIDELRARRNRR